MFDNANAKDTDVWDDDTGETVGEARARFAKHGSVEVEPAVARQLVRAGYEVWSFGYGDEPAAFTVVNADDLETWDDDPEEMDNEWGPFRFDAELGDADAPVRFALAFIDDWSMSPFLDDVTRDLLSIAHDTLRSRGIGNPLPETSILTDAAIGPSVEHVTREPQS